MRGCSMIWAQKGVRLSCPPCPKELGCGLKLLQGDVYCSILKEKHPLWDLQCRNVASFSNVCKASKTQFYEAGRQQRN